MFTFDATDVQRLVVSAIGALLVSTMCIVGAVGPAKANPIDAATNHPLVASGALQPAAR